MRQKHHLLSILLREGSSISNAREPEFTSFLQLGKSQIRSHVDVQRAQMSPFAEICRQLDCACPSEFMDQTPGCRKEGNLDLFGHHDGETKHLGCSEPDRSLLDSLNEVLVNMQQPDWNGLNTDFEQLPSLHPHASLALQCAAAGALVSDGMLHIYTDGACRRGKAAWAFVVLQQRWHNGYEFYHRIGFAAGASNDQLEACEVTALNAEATAIIAVAEFLLSLGDLSERHIQCHFDAQSVGWGAFGRSNCCTLYGEQSNRQRAARLLISLVQRRAGSLEGRHVHAHDGHPWNEFVDSVAGAVTEGWQPARGAQLRSQYLLQHPLREWAWMQIQPDIELPALEFVLENQPPTLDKGWIDSTLANRRPQDQADTWSTTLRIATANVGTLDQNNVDERTGITYKTNEILHQMSQQQIHIMAVQEGRAKTSRHVTHGPFDCIISAGDRGQAGVELWFNTEALQEVCGCTIRFQSDICVWYSTPRILAVSCRLGSVHIEVLVGYAPQAGKAVTDITEWWQDVDHVLAQISRDATIIFLGDFNCKIGSVTCDGIGDHDAGFEDAGGECFRHVCAKHGLLVPSTWSTFHHGTSDTYCGPKGHTSRIDYIAVGHQAQPGIIKTFVATDMDLLNGDRDHHPLVLDLALQFTQGRHMGYQKQALYDRALAKAHKGMPEWDILSYMPLQE